MNINLSSSQQRAADGFQNFLDDPSIPYMVISGFAGSGKSYLVKYLIELAAQQTQVQQMLDPKWTPPTLYFTATTHKAVNILSNMVNRPAMTIHQLLGLRPQFRNGQSRLVRKSKRRGVLVNSIIVIDEASMIGNDLMYHITEARKSWSTCRFVFIGDPYQLTPVKEPMCPIFNDPDHHFFLDEIQRQVANNPIIQLSAQYREVLDDPNKDWPEVQADNKHVFYYEDYNDFRDVIQNAMQPGTDPKQRKILAWSNQTVRDYNKWIRKLHGYRNDFEVGELVMSNTAILDGDRPMVMTDSQHYIRSIVPDKAFELDGYWIQLESASTRRGSATVFQPRNWRDVNQLIKQFEKDQNYVAVRTLREGLADLRPTHALTCHKAQGSTYNEVFVDMSDIARNNQWSEAARLAYVAVTRAADKVHIYGKLRNTYQTKTNLMEHFSNAPIHP